MKRATQLPTSLETITPGDVRRLLAETVVALVNGEITTKQANATRRACGRITRKLNQGNQRLALAVKIARLPGGSKPK
jgi:hypothetical protein